MFNKKKLLTSAFCVALPLLGGGAAYAVSSEGGPSVPGSASLTSEAAMRVGTNEQQILAALELSGKISSLLGRLRSDPHFVAVELRYNPLRIVVLGTKTVSVQEPFDVPVESVVVPVAKADLDARVKSAVVDGVGFAARPDYVRGVVVVTTDDPGRIAPVGFEYEFGTQPQAVASGGERIFNGANCTSAFRVNGNSVLTAAHCRNDSGDIYPWQGGTQSIGTAFNQNCNNDVQVHVVNGSSDPTVQGVPIIAYDAPYVGMPIRKFGYATGNTAGTVVATGVQWTLVGSSECASPSIVLSGFQSNAPSFPGDSGGPTIVCRDQTCSGAAGVGITSAEFSAGTYSTDLSAALAASGSWLG